MPPVAIAAAVIAGAGAAVAGATLATVVAIASVAFSVTAALTTKTPSFDSYASPQERKQVLRAAAAPKLAIYGEVMGSGVLFFAEEQPGQQDQDELLHMCIAIAGHEIDSIGQIYLNDEPIESFGEYVTWELHNNRQVADPFLLENCPSWSSDMIGKGIAFLRISLKFNADKFPNGIPNIKLVKRGYKVLDPRTGTTAWSANSALVYLHYLKNFCDVKDADILVEQFKSCANICDELVGTSAGTGVRYRTHGEFDFNESRTKVMEALLLSCAGDRVYTGGKHGMMVGAYQGPATLELHSRQVTGDIQITPEAAERDRFNTYKGKFINAKEKWAESDFPPVRVAEWVTQDGKEISKDIDFRFVTNEFQAQRICSIKMRRTRVGSILQVPMNYSGFSYRPGMNIKVFIPELAIDGVEYRVDSWSFSVLGGVKLILSQDNAQMYGDIPGQAVFQPPITNLPSSGPPAPSNLRYTARPVGDVVQGLLSWENFGNQVADNVVNIYRSGVLQYSVRTPANECILSGLAVGTYEARVQAIAANGVGSPMSTLSFTIAVPAAPNSITFIPANWSLQLIPNFSTQRSFGTICEFFYSEVNIPIEQVEATAFKLGMGTTLMHSGLTPDTTYYYWVRSINAYGKSAFFAASGKTSYDAASILDILDGEIGAEHLREDLRTPIEQIPDIAGKLALVEREFTDLSEIAERVPVIDQQMTGLGDALAALGERATQTESLLRDEQDSLGQMGIGTVLQQDKLHGKIDRVQEEMGDLRDAIFTVNPGTGEIEMDVVRALRDETQASFTQVNQKLDGATGTLATKADHAVVDAQGERLTEAEQVLDGINAKITQTVTKSEFTSEQQRLTEVSSSLDAAVGQIQQKAAQSTVTEQGERLAAAEQRITVNSDTQSALAERVSGLKAELEADDQTLLANITEVAWVSTEADQVLAQRVSGVEVRTGTAEGKIRALEEIVESDGGITAGRFDEITAALSLNSAAAEQAGAAAEQAAEASIANALAGEAGEQRHRHAEASIRHDQQVQLNLHQALAREVTVLDARFEGEKADTAANFTEVREVVAGVEQSTTLEISQLITDYQAADSMTTAALEESNRALSAADQALSERVTQLQVTLEADDQTLNAAILETQRTQAQGDQALSERVTQLQAKVVADDKALDAAIKQTQQAQVTGDSALATRMDQMQATLEADDRTLNAAILETQRTQAQGDKALAGQVTQLQAQVTNGDTALSSAIQQTRQAQAAGDKANADAITTVQAKLNTTTAAVQTVASAVADLEGDVEAGWYTKAQINGEGGGFGLSVKMNADGSMVSSFIVDADVFAVMSRAGGVGTKRNPFVIKNGTVYMNHALMDTAEIGNVIAKYIKVTSLSAVTIENSQFKGGNAGFGPGGPYSGWGEGWHTIIYSDGRIYTNKLYASAGSFTGEVNANSGTFNNVVMRENCTIMGKLKAEQVEGGFYVKRIYGGKSLPDNTDSSWRTAATILVSNGMQVSRVIEISASAGHYEVLCKVESSGSSSLTRTATGHYEVRIIRDGVIVEYVAPFSISVSATSYPSSGPREEQARGLIGVSKTAIVPGDGNPHTYAVQFRFVRVGGDGASGSYAVAGCDSNDKTTAQLYISSPDLS